MPDPLRRMTTRLVWWTCGIAVALAIVMVSLPAGHHSWFQPLNLSLAREAIFPALQAYAGDHEGRYPDTLEELVGEYLSTIDEVKYVEDESEDRSDWNYVHGLRKTSPAKWIVLVSPTYRNPANPESADRVVVYNNGEGGIIPADEFHRKFAAQLKAMAAQPP